MGLDEQQERLLTQFLFKLQVDPEYLKEYMRGPSNREDLLEPWGFNNEIRQALQNVDHQALKELLNPITLPICGWIKFPGEP